MYDKGDTMQHDLIKLKTELDMNKYSLKDLALFFEKYDGYVYEIKTTQRILKFKIEANSLPHLIGLQHAFKGKKNKNKYKGASGFAKIKNGELTYNDVMKSIKNNHNDKIEWSNIKNRKYMPIFLNTITSNNTKLKIRDNYLISRKIFMNGNYFLYKSLSDNKYPMFSLKKVNNEKVVIETFIVDNDISLLGALKNEEIVSIKVFAPLNKTNITTKKEYIKN